MKKILFSYALTMSYLTCFSQIDGLKTISYMQDSSIYQFESIGKNETVKIMYLDSSIQSEYTTVENVINGRHIAYYENGRIKFIRWYVYGVEAGTWLSYYANGTLKEVRRYSFNTALFSKPPIVDTTLVDVRQHEDIPHYDTIISLMYNIPDLVYTFFPNGMKEHEETYVNRQKHGQWNYYNESGKLVRQEAYNDGRLINKVEF